MLWDEMICGKRVWDSEVLSEELALISFLLVI